MKLVLPGKPIALKRHRYTKFGKSYNPSRILMNQISFIAKAQVSRDQILQIYNKPLIFIAHFYFLFPKKIKCESNRLIKPNKPDIDNLLKFYSDCFNGLFYRDDSQIVQIIAKKFYATYNKTIIVIKDIKEHYIDKKKKPQK